jgi:glucose/arabinose dehydrogenase
MQGKWGAMVVLVIILGLILPADAAAFGSLPSGFQDQLVVDGVTAPTAFDWLPDGDLLITTQEGILYRWDSSGGSSHADVALDLRDTICSGGEMGLLGVAVDPNFDSGSPFIYLYYTDKQGGNGCGADNRANRVSRFTVDNSGNIGEERVLIDKIPALGGNHNGGDLQFDKNGLLYVSVGDSGEDIITGDGQDNNGNARRLSLLNGKILRIKTDGSVPNDNPFIGSDSVPCAATGKAPATKAGVQAEKKHHKGKKAGKRAKHKHKKKRRHLRNASICQEIFATGLRNPFRIAFDPDSGASNQRFFINDVGGSAWEEIDEGAKGADYGWNIREGPCKTGTTDNCSPDSRFEEPLFAYEHGACGTITGGAFVPDDSGWPAEFLHSYLFADFNCSTLFVISDTDPGAEADEFGTGTTAVHLAFGPDNALYYSDVGNGQIRRIRFTG